MERRTTCAAAGCTSLIVSCEHGGNDVPPAYRGYFAGRAGVLETHRGWDPGALEMARDLAHGLRAALFVATTTRLLIDLNRSPGHPALYSEFTRGAPPAVKRGIYEQHYLPYRQRIERQVAAAIGTGTRVVHVSSHSFTPELAGETRTADIGLLYDPRRAAESRLCAHWRERLREVAPAVRVRRNYPYQGRADGLVTSLRRGADETHYVGVELEVNQQYVMRGGDEWSLLRRVVVSSLRAALADAGMLQGVEG